MKARIEYDWARGDWWKVWLYRPAGPNLTAQVIGVGEDGHLLMRNIEDGAALPAPSFILPGQALEALVREATKVLPPSDATVDALKDAREMRDRLLAMVERTQDLWTRPPT